MRYLLCGYANIVIQPCQHDGGGIERKPVNLKRQLLAFAGHGVGVAAGVGKLVEHPLVCFIGFGLVPGVQVALVFGFRVVFRQYCA